MEYTDHERAAFKDVYAKRLRMRLVVIVLLTAAMALLAITEGESGISGPVFGPIAVVAIFVGWAIFEIRNWRCPACDQNLGRAISPKHCRRCGIELRGSSHRSGVR